MAPLHVTRDNAAEKGLPSEIFAGDDETGRNSPSTDLVLPSSGRRTPTQDPTKYEAPAKFAAPPGSRLEAVFCWLLWKQRGRPGCSCASPASARQACFWVVVVFSHPHPHCAPPPRPAGRPAGGGAPPSVLHLPQEASC